MEKNNQMVWYNIYTYVKIHICIYYITLLLNALLIKYPQSNFIGW